MEANCFPIAPRAGAHRATRVTKAKMRAAARHFTSFRPFVEGADADGGEARGLPCEKPARAERLALGRGLCFRQPIEHRLREVEAPVIPLRARYAHGAVQHPFVNPALGFPSFSAA